LEFGLSKIISGDRQRQIEIEVQSLPDSLLPLTWRLVMMMEAETVSETLDFDSELTRLRVTFKYYIHRNLFAKFRNVISGYL
jgi:hypothetical protein